nr:MAG TPA: hypothetical protein [Caudoviricetes sp.]
MLKIENTEVMGWEAAIRGMRNPKNSWEKSDSFIPCYLKTKCHECEANQKCAYYFEDGNGLPYKKDEFIGSKDLDLMTRLRNAGTDHRKFMRMITVYLDITAPLYWWKEFDTYKVGTVANSCSTMHKIADKEFTLEDFSCEHILESKDVNRPDNSCCNWNWEGCEIIAPIDILEETINMLNKARKMFLETKDKKYWWQMIQLLPSSYNQRRTIMLNYEVLANIYKSRRNHKLDEWHTFCDWIETLPYSVLIIGE